MVLINSKIATRFKLYLSFLEILTKPTSARKISCHLDTWRAGRARGFSVTTMYCACLLYILRKRRNHWQLTVACQFLDGPAHFARNWRSLPFRFACPRLAIVGIFVSWCSFWLFVLLQLYLLKTLYTCNHKRRQCSQQIKCTTLVIVVAPTNSSFGWN